MTSAADIFSRAADLLETKGWTQDAYARDDVGNDVISKDDCASFCILGAINQARGADIDAAVTGELRRTLLDIIGHDENIADWNDYYDRKKEQVIGVLRKAATV